MKKILVFEPKIKISGKTRLILIVSKPIKVEVVVVVIAVIVFFK